MEKITSERRYFSPENSEIRADMETGVISGYPIVFNKRSKLLYGQFYEKIVPDAMKGVIENSDCLALLDHDRSRGILGRSVFGKGTLSMEIREKGVFVEFTPPETPLSQEVKQYLKRGEIDSMSFEFWLAEGGDAWEERRDGYYDRTLLKFKEVTDISLVYKPAYPQTSVSIRSLEDYKRSLEGPPEEKPTLHELNKYWNEQNEKLKQFKK